MSNRRYDFQKRPEVLGVSRLLYVSASQFGEDWHSAPHTHGCTELFYCLHGTGEFSLEDRTAPVGPDDLVIVNPNVEHTERSSSADPLEYIVLGIDGLSFHYESSSAYQMLHCHDARDTVRFYLDQLLHEAQEKPEGWETVCQHLLEVLLTKLLRLTHFTMEFSPSQRVNKEVAAARRYIDEHYTEPLSLDQLAEIAHVNKYYLVHSFNREYGVSPISYLIGRRIRESRYLLENTDHSLSQISHLMGFSSPSYFSQSFRRIMGMSAMEYRKRHQQSVADKANLSNSSSDAE